MITTINTPQELTTHIEKLLLIEPRFLPIYTRVGVPTLRRQMRLKICLMRRSLKL